MVFVYSMLSCTQQKKGVSCFSNNDCVCHTWHGLMHNCNTWKILQFTTKVLLFVMKVVKSNNNVYRKTALHCIKSFMGWKESYILLTTRSLPSNIRYFLGCFLKILVCMINTMFQNILLSVHRWMEVNP